MLSLLTLSSTGTLSGVCGVWANRVAHLGFEARCLVWSPVRIRSGSRERFLAQLGSVTGSSQPQQRALVPLSCGFVLGRKEVLAWLSAQVPSSVCGAGCSQAPGDGVLGRWPPTASRAPKWAKTPSPALRAFTLLRNSSRGEVLPRDPSAALALALGGGWVIRVFAAPCLDGVGHGYSTGYTQPAPVSNDVR